MPVPGTATMQLLPAPGTASDVATHFLAAPDSGCQKWHLTHACTRHGHSGCQKWHVIHACTRHGQENGHASRVSPANVAHASRSSGPRTAPCL